MLKAKQGDTELFDIEAYQYNAEIMGEVNLSCEVYLDVPNEDFENFSLDMYVNINGENLYLSSFEPTGVKNTDNTYPKYSLVFESKRVELKRKYFRDLTSDTGIDWGTEYAFYGNIADFATRFQKNLTKYFLNNEWSIEVYGNHSQDVSVLFEASNLYLFDALKQMSETWDKEWRIVSSGATNVIQVGFPQETLDHNFEYEGGNAGGGLTVIQKEVDTSNIITRMLSAGSTKNIPYQYFRQLSESELEAGNVQDPNVAPLFSNGYYNLMPKCFREYIKGWNEGSIGTEYTPPRPTRRDEFWKGYDDGRETFFGNSTYNPITYYEKNINLWGEREGVVEVNEEIFPTITDVTIDGVGLIDEVVDVEQISFNSQEIQNNYYDGANIISDLGYILNPSIDTHITNSNPLIFSYNSASIPLLNTQQLVFNHYNFYGFIPTPINKTITSKLIIQREQSPDVWIDVHEYLTNGINTDQRFGLRDCYIFEKDITYQTSISGNYRFKIDINILLPNNTSSIRTYIGTSLSAKVTNLSYGNRIDIADISDRIDDGIDNSEGYVLLSSNKYSQEFDVVGFTQQINLGLCKISGRSQYDLSIPNENDVNGTLMVAATVILQQKTSDVWNNYAFINIPFEVTRVTKYVPSVLLYGDFIGSSLQVFNCIPIGTYRLKTELRLWRNTSIPRANQLVSVVDLDLSNMYQSKLSYSSYFNIWIKDIGFNINDYKSSQPAQLNFTTGAIAGEDYLFEINEVTPDTSRTYIKDEVTYTSAYRLKCLKSDADKDATGLSIPNTFKQGQAGDKFILLNINMPYTPYVLNAEERLEAYVKAELDKVCDAKRAFSIEIYDPFISSFAETNKLITGNYIKIKHTNLIGSGSTATVQIKGITITQSKGDMFPKFAIILSEESSITRPTITRGGGIIGDLYRRYRDLGDRFDNVTRNVSSINTNLGRTINVDTFNNNYRQVSGVNKEINALALSAKTTADEKNKCWTIKPIPPYYEGDQWLVDAGEEFNIGEVVYCITTRLEGKINYNDWSLSRYKGITEINTSINNVIGAIPSGSTVIEEINTVKGIAEDKNKSWTITPTTPYYKGDQWLSDSGEISTCIRTKLSGDFDGLDWRMPRYIGSSELIEKIGVLPLDVDDKERTVADLIGNVPKDKTLYSQIEAISLIANEAYRMSRPKSFINVYGIQDEKNKTFNTAEPFVLGSSRIYILKDAFFRGVDYNELDESTFEFISYAPSEKDFIMFEAIIDN